MRQPKDGAGGAVVSCPPPKKKKKKIINQSLSLGGCLPEADDRIHSRSGGVGSGGRGGQGKIGEKCKAVRLWPPLAGGSGLLPLVCSEVLAPQCSVTPSIPHGRTAPPWARPPRGLGGSWGGSMGLGGPPPSSPLSPEASWVLGRAREEGQ